MHHIKKGGRFPLAPVNMSSQRLLHYNLTLAGNYMLNEFK